MKNENANSTEYFETYRRLLYKIFVSNILLLVIIIYILNLVV